MKAIVLSAVFALLSFSSIATSPNREWSCRGVRITENLNLRIIDVHNENRINYTSWERRYFGTQEWQFINKGVFLHPDNSLETSEASKLMVSGTLVKIIEENDEYAKAQIISIPGKARETLTKLAQMDTSFTPEQIESLVNIPMAAAGEVGFYKKGICNTFGNCNPTRELSVDDIYFFSASAARRLKANHRNSSKLIPKGKLYKVIKAENSFKSGYLNRPCENIASRRTEKTVWNQTIFLGPKDFDESTIDLRHPETYEDLIEVSLNLMDNSFLNFVERRNASSFEQIIRRISFWDLDYDYINDSVRDRFNNFYDFGAADFINDMNLIRIPSLPSVVDGRVMFKGPFNSYHYVMGDEFTRIENFQYGDRANPINREWQRDSYLEPTAACGFLSFLELHQRACMFEVHRGQTQEIENLSLEEKEDYDPLDCHKSDNPEQCRCTPVQWGDMFAPYGLHKTHDDKVCVDIRFIKTDGRLGTGMTGRFDLRKNREMVQRLCDAGATTILFGQNVSRLNQYLNKVARERGKSRSRCRVVDANAHSSTSALSAHLRSHYTHFHVCFDKRRMNSEDREVMENTCYHPQMFKRETYEPLP